MPPKPAARGAPKPQWAILQRKIFSRWCKQKLSRRPGVKVVDIVKDLPDVLIDLLEVLSDTKFPGKKPKKPPTMRIQRVEYTSLALKFCWELGVKMGVKPSAENVIDANEKAIMALVWAIMMRFMKIGDDDDDQQLNAKDALMIWVQNKTQGYEGVDVQNFKQSFHDGLALCAIVHKHRPKLLEFDSLEKTDKMGNIQKAMDAAEAYFQLEQYLKPEELVKLDENSMVVYVSEYYYGIAEQKKLDLAARRIGKVIKLTEENDAMRAEYNGTAAKLRGRLDAVEKILGDRTIDNTMAGAKAKIEEFYTYKTNDKNVILADQLLLEALFNNLSMRLAHHKRPEFVPESGLGLRDLVAAIAHLEACEQERNVALHQELNRQIKLVKLAENHAAVFGKLESWAQEKRTYLETREDIDSVSSATLQLRLLDAFDEERKSRLEKSVNALNALGAELLAEKYEHSSDVQAHMDAVADWFSQLDELSKAKRPVLDDALAREQFKEKVLLMVQRHIDQYNQLGTWITNKTEYLNREETIKSVNDAVVQLTLLSQFDAERAAAAESRVAELCTLGAEILAAKYETEHSSWSFEHPEEIEEREMEINTGFSETLVNLSAAKKEALDKAKELETEKERLRIEFAHLAADFVRWSKETVDSVSMFMFGFTLEEVEAYKATLDHDDEEISAEAGRSTEEARNVAAQMDELGVTENPYTSLTLADFTSEGEAVAAGQAARLEAYNAELERVRANDALCKHFAELAEPFSSWINEQKDRISTSKDELDAQMAFVVERETNLESEGAVLSEIREVVGQMEEAGITNITHTNLTGKDVEVQWEQYQKFLLTKKSMLATEIEHAKLRGITVEQFAEIEDNFNRFDKDQSGSIDRKELTACLYSLGEERTAKEIKEIVAEYGAGGQTIPYENFKEFMIHLLGDTDTKEEIIDGFLLINRGNEMGKKELMTIVMTDEDVAYVERTAPPVEGGMDFKAWTEDVFSR